MLYLDFCKIKFKNLPRQVQKKYRWVLTQKDVDLFEVL